MNLWIIIFLLVYIILLIFSALKSRKSIINIRDYFLAGSKTGYVLGFLTFSATLFSTFTLMGMPNFFRVHGVGAWIFLGVTDTALAFVLLWFGLKLRKKVKSNTYTNLSTLLQNRYNSQFAKYVFLFGIFVFLIPYVAIQIKGISGFLTYALPINIPTWAWSFIFLIIILLYSYFGGLKAIMYSDAVQGLLLLIATFVIGYVCIEKLGGIDLVFTKVKSVNEGLLSIPGPKGLMTPQFLIASFLAIILMPITQPQLFTRMIIMKDSINIKRMAIGVGIFAFLIILPTVFIGFYGSVFYPTDSPSEFLYKSLISDQANIIGALALVGLIAAAMSTADSQLFALETEVSKINDNNGKKNKIAIIVFSILVLLLSIISNEELALLARVSFAGTSLLAPMIIVGIFYSKNLNLLIPILTLFGLLLYLMSNLTSIIPSQILGVRLDLGLLVILSLTTFLNVLLKKIQVRGV